MGNFYPSNIFGNHNIKALIIWLLSKGIEWISTNKYYIIINLTSIILSISSNKY